MKLGTDTNSLVNHMMSRSSCTPAIGMGATLLRWTDRNGATVIGWNGKLLTVQQDFAKRTDSNGYGGQQEYDHTPNPDGAVSNFKLTPKGWVEVHYNPDTQRWNTVGKGGIAVGYRETYYDPSF